MEDNQLKNQLISFNKNTGKITVLADIKDFFWLDFDSETKTINGYNNKEQIEITISEWIVFYFNSKKQNLLLNEVDFYFMQIFSFSARRTMLPYLR